MIYSTLLNPNKATSDYRNVQIGIILDKSPEPASFVFQNKLDVQKNSVELGLGTKFIDYMALLSLSGFGALCGNQFHSVKGVNRFRLQEIATALAEKKSIGKSEIFGDPNFFMFMYDRFCITVYCLLVL